MITKKIAGDLYGNGFMLQDKEGRIFKIESVHSNHFLTDNPFNHLIAFNQIGTEYHILARPLSDLTKEITHNGLTFVPIVELAKKFHTLSEETCKGGYRDIIDAGSYGIQVSCFIDKDRHGYYSIYGDNDLMFHNDAREVNKLIEWNFAISLPEGSWTPVTDNNNPYK